MKLPSSTFLTASFALCLSAACSDPPTPPAQGAVAESIQPNGGGTGCNASSAVFTAPGNADPVSGTFATLNCDLSAGTGCAPNQNIVVDGDSNASVNCSVSGGGTYNVNATLSQGDVEFSISGSISDTGGTAAVSSSHNTFHLQDLACNITITPNKGQIKAGAIWADFDCKKFGDPSVGQDPGCEAMGKFIFENCSK